MRTTTTPRESVIRGMVTPASHPIGDASSAAHNTQQNSTQQPANNREQTHPQDQSAPQTDRMTHENRRAESHEDTQEVVQARAHEGIREVKTERRERRVGTEGSTRRDRTEATTSPITTTRRDRTEATTSPITTTHRDRTEATTSPVTTTHRDRTEATTSPVATTHRDRTEATTSPITTTHRDRTEATTSPVATTHRDRTEGGAGSDRTGVARSSEMVAGDSQQTTLTTTSSRYSNLENAYPYPLFGTEQTLRTMIFTDHTNFNDTTPEAIFGASSTLVPAHTARITTSHSLSENAIYQCFVLVLAIAYATLIYHYINDIRVLISRVHRGTASGERIAIDHGNNINPFINIATVIGMLFVGLAVVKSGDRILSQSMITSIHFCGVIAISLAATLLFALVHCYQVLIVRCAGAVTLSQPLIAQLMILKRTYFALLVIALSPALLLYALTPHNSGDVWLYVMAVELVVAVILYLRDTLNLFISKKISILHWILYLCAVDIFPFSFIWLLGVR